jgi:hypothetical protein
MNSFSSRVIPYIKEGDRYYILKKYENKIKNKFNNLVEA